MRDLTLTVTAETSQAKRALADVDTAIAKLTADFKAGSITTQQYYEKLQTLATTATKAKTGADGLSAAQNTLEPATKKSATATDLLTSKLMQYVSGAAVLGAIKHTLAYASSLEAMKAATDISFKGLQQLENIAVGSNTTLQALTSSVLDLQRRLATGDDSAAAAMRALKINTEQFLLLKGDAQFLLLARTLGAMTDEVERNKMAFLLFGRTYKEILPALVGDVDTLKNSLRLLADDSVTNLARADAALQRFWVSLKRNVGEALSLRGALGLLLPAAAANPSATAAQWSQLPTLPTAPGLSTGAPLEDLTLSAGALDRAYTELDDALKSNQRAFKEHTEVTKKAGEAQKALRKSILEIENVLPGLRTEIGYSDDSVLKLGDQIRALTKDLSAVERHGWSTAGVMREFAGDLEQLGEHIDPEQIHAWAQEWAFTGPTLDMLDRKTQTWQQDLTDLAGGLTQLAQVSGDSFGGMVKDLAVLVVSWDLAAQSVTQYQQATTKAGKLTAGLGMAGALWSATGGGGAKGILGGMAAGAQIGMMFGPWGAAIGAAAGALVGVVRAVKGVSQAVKDARTEVGKFQDEITGTLTRTQLLEAGGEDWKATVIGVRDAYLLTGRSVEDADAAVRNLWASAEGGADATKAAMAPIQYALELQRRATETLTETVGRYQFSIEELGPALSRQKLSEQAQQLYTDWMVLTGAGIDVAAVGREMAESINAFLKAAINTGVEVDIAMKPMLQRMVDMGLLTDENGKKLKDLSGIKFSETMSEGFTRIVDAVKELTDTIKRGLGLALDDTSDKINKMPDVHVRVIYDDPGMPGMPSVEAPELVMGVRERAARGLHLGGMVLPFLTRAHQGLAVDEVPIIAQTGEGILNRGAMRRIGGAGTLNRMNAGGGGGGGPLTVNVTVRGGVIDDEQTQRRLAQIVTDRIDENMQERRKFSAR